MQPRSPLDLLEGDVIPDAPREDGFFWKPETPCYLIGKLDRIEAGKQYGDYAVFSDAVVFRAGDHKPLSRHTEIAVALGASLKGKISTEDSGVFFAIVFDKWVSTKNGRMRVYEVRAHLTPTTTAALLARSMKALDNDNGAPDDEEQAE